MELVEGCVDFMCSRGTYVFVTDLSTLMIICLESLSVINLLGYRDWSGHTRGSNEAV